MLRRFGRQMLTIFTALMPLALATACVTEAPATEAKDDGDERALYVCKGEAGAPHQVMTITEVQLTAQDLADARAEEQEDDDGEPTLPETITEEKTVRVEVNEVDQGVHGHCFRKMDAGSYACATFDGALRLDWPTANKADAKVEVKEKWLFGTKTYIAQCRTKPK